MEKGNKNAVDIVGYGLMMGVFYLRGFLRALGSVTSFLYIC